jgi:XTP/dITP diphosphohydrolase
MQPIYSATQNQHKLKEINALLDGVVEVRSIYAFNLTEELPETGDTLTDNALQKARYIYNRFNVSCFADDTGLEIEALNGQPGVYSARFAGDAKDPEANMQKVITMMNGVSNRKACFKTVIALILDGKEYLFEGQIDGVILESRAGDEGFGYDPIFLPNGYAQSFAQMPLSLKNQISHRALAVKKMVDFLSKKDLH